MDRRPAGGTTEGGGAIKARIHQETVMRRTRALLAVVVLGAVSATAKASEADARAILDRAIKAHGGAAALTRAQVCSRTDTGSLSAPMREVKFTSEVYRDLPDRLKLVIKADMMRSVVVLNGDKGWVQGPGPAVEMTKPYHERMRNEAYVWWVSTLVPLTRGGFALSTIPDTRVDGDLAAGVRASRKGTADTNLYFSKRTGLLLKIARRVPDAGLLADREYFFSEHKDFGGVKLATKERVSSNALREAEYTVSDYRFPRSLDAGMFNRP
jgi:hypothetical protein